MKHPDGRWLLTLGDFFGGAAGEAAATLIRLAQAGHWPRSASEVTHIGFDETSWLALRDHLEQGGIVSSMSDLVDADAAKSTAATLEITFDAVAAALARIPEPPSRLVVTATASVNLAAIRDTLHVPSLYELIERTVRSAHRSVTLGAPFWNDAAISALTPAVEGALDRGCGLHLVVQGGHRRPSRALYDIAAWANGLRSHGQVVVWHFDADDLADRHIQLHAKFALADDTTGYLGSANLTDQGFEINFEIGAALGTQEVRQLHALLDDMRAACVLTRH